jgi:DNA polymerase-3 subunit beta
MKITITQEKLARALNVVSRVASTRTELSVLNNVLLQAEGSNLVLSATNLEVAVVEKISAKVSKSGLITIPAKLLTDFINTLPSGQVTIEVKNNHLHISSGNYKSTINGTNSEDFPELPLIDTKQAVVFKVNIDDFKHAVAQTIVTASSDTTRPALTGVYFNTSKNSLYLASTDGYRLSEKKFIDKVSSEIFAIVPAQSLQEVLRSLNDDYEELEILFNENQVKFVLGEIEITSKLIDGSFPDYRQLIPKATDIALTLDKDELLRDTKLAGLFTSSSGGSIVLEAKATESVLSVQSVASELGENNSDIETKVNADGKVTLNSRFLIDGLNSLSDKQINFGFSGKLNPCVLKNNTGDDYIHIIMPLKS